MLQFLFNDEEFVYTFVLLLFINRVLKKIHYNFVDNFFTLINSQTKTIFINTMFFRNKPIISKTFKTLNFLGPLIFIMFLLSYCFTNDNDFVLMNNIFVSVVFLNVIKPYDTF